MWRQKQHIRTSVLVITAAIEGNNTTPSDKFNSAVKKEAFIKDPKTEEMHIQAHVETKNKSAFFNGFPFAV